MYRTLKAPLNVQVELTWGCPNRCRHCYNSFRHNETPILTLSSKQVNFIARELVDNNICRVTLTGGEPLMVPKLALQATRILTAHNIAVGINTTLMGLTPELAQNLKDLGVRAIMTSLISSNPKTHEYVTQNPGSWQKTVDGIRLAISFGFRVNVNMVLTKWNIHELEKTGDFVGELGATTFGATRACAPTPLAVEFSQYLLSLEELRQSLALMYHLKDKWGYNVDVFEHYPWCALQDIEKYAHLARRKCTAGITSVSIGADGDLRPCGHSANHYGNIFTDGLAGAWAKMTDWRLGLHTQQSCTNCKFVKQCTGGCPVESENSPRKRDHHTTGPTDVISLPKQKTISIENPEGDYSYISGVIFREETFGGIIGSSRSEIVYVDEITFKLAKMLVSLPHFNVKTLISLGVSREDSSVFINHLVGKKILRKEVPECQLNS